MARCGSRSGIVLILVSAMVVILLLLSLLLLQVAHSMALHASARGEAQRRRLAAFSGSDYAAARLSQDAMPRFTPAANDRGDDWTYRDASGADLSAALNPSYSHGEAWDDASTFDGVYAGADPKGPDRDGDGRFSAWSGRLRGGGGGGRGGTHDLPFTHRIECQYGKIPLNAGWLWAGDGIDNDGDGLVDEAGEPDGVDNDMDFQVDEAGECVDFDGPWKVGNGIPDHSELAVPYHASLALVLNNLAAILHHPAAGPPAFATRCWDIPSGADTTGDGVGDGDPVQAAWLGEDLIRNRPKGGYRSWAQVEQTLLNLNPAVYPGAPYRKDEIEAIKPYVDLGPYGFPCDSARGGAGLTLHVPRYAPVHLYAASPEVLGSLWRYLSSSPYAYPVSIAGTKQVRLTGDFPGETAGFPVINPRSLLQYVDTTDYAIPPASGTYRFQRPMILPGDAARLVQAALAFRRGSARGWRELRRHLHDQSAILFPEDQGALGPSAPLLARSWIAAKTELAFQAVCEDPPPPSAGFRPSALWAFGGAVSPAPPFVTFDGIRRVPYPWTGYTPGNPAPWPLSWPPSPAYTSGHPYWTQGSVIRPQGLTLAPPVRFSVQARSGNARAEGLLFAGERLDFTSQEDFERLAGGTRFRGTGIEAIDSPPVKLRRGAPLGHSPAIVTLPRWNRRSLPNPLSPPEVTTDPLAPPLYGFSRAYGAVGLGTSTVPDGLGAAKLYWPFTEDFDPQDKNPLSIPAWKEFWSHFSPTVTPPWSGPPRQPPFRHFPDVMMLEEGWMPLLSPYGFTAGRGGMSTSEPWSAGLCLTGQPGAPRDWMQWPGNRYSLASPYIDQLSVEGRFGVGSQMVFWFESGYGTYSVFARRGFRPPGTWGTEFTVSIAAGVRNVISPTTYPAVKSRTWLVADADPKASGGWSYHLVLTLQKNLAAVPQPKTTVTLFVNGDSGSADGPMTFQYDAMESAALREEGLIRKGGSCAISHVGVDEVRFYETALPSPPAVGPRYVASGTFQSPLYVLDSRANLSQAAWTGAVPAGGTLQARVIGYRDAAGGTPVGAVTCLSDTAVYGLKGGIAEPVRSFRYEVEMSRSPTVDEPPILESIWITLQRKGSSPAWRTWTER